MHLPEIEIKCNVSLISYIHYLHLEAFEIYNMPTIACHKVLTCDCFVCSLKELISLTDFLSSTEVSSLTNLSVLSFPCILFVSSIIGISSSSEGVSLCFQYFLTNCFQVCVFIWTLNITFIRTRVYWDCICDLTCRPILLSLGTSQSSSWASHKFSSRAFVLVPSKWFLRWNVTVLLSLLFYNRDTTYLVVSLCTAAVKIRQGHLPEILCTDSFFCLHTLPFLS